MASIFIFCFIYLMKVSSLKQGFLLIACSGFGLLSILMWLTCIFMKFTLFNVSCQTYNSLTLAFGYLLSREFNCATLHFYIKIVCTMLSLLFVRGMLNRPHAIFNFLLITGMYSYKCYLTEYK